MLSEIKGSAKAEMIGGDTPYLETNYLNGGECLFVDSENNVDTDDVIILWDGSQAGTIYHGFTGALGSTFKAYKIACLGLFIFQQLKKNQQTIYDKYRTPNIPHVIKTFKDEYNIMLTSEREQNEIGSYFQQIDNLITLHQRKYDALKSMKKTLLSKMFPKNGEDVPEIRFKGFTDAWEQRKLGEIAISFSGGTPKVGESSFYGGDIPFIRSGEIGSYRTELTLSLEGLNNSSASLVNKGDILYALYGATSGEVEISKINGAINQAILAIRPYDDFDSYTIVQWLKKEKENIISTYLQGGQGNLSGAIIKNLDLVLPSKKEEQKLIGKYFKMIDNLITLHQRKLDELKNMKKTLLQQMFV